VYRFFLFLRSSLRRVKKNLSFSDSWLSRRLHGQRRRTILAHDAPVQLVCPSLPGDGGEQAGSRRRGT